MSSHADLVDSNQIAGGYRVSTSVTAPGANGVTSNQSATVHTNYGQDSVTMNRDGSFSIDNAGQSVTLAKGQSTALSGGATVTANQNGSLTISASNAQGGSIATTMSSNGQAVDVSSHAHDIALGGDAVTHDTQRPYQPVSDYEG
jgi:flagellar basal body rod protein FlgG